MGPTGGAAAGADATDDVGAGAGTGADDGARAVTVLTTGALLTTGPVGSTAAGTGEAT